MRTTNHQTPDHDLFSQFTDSRLNYQEMFAVRGGDNDTSDTDEGSTLDQQDDGFN